MQLFYATAWKRENWKSDFGNLIIVAHLRMKSLFEFPHIKTKGKTAVRITIKKSIGHGVPIKSIASLAKTFLNLLYNIQK